MAACENRRSCSMQIEHERFRVSEPAQWANLLLARSQESNTSTTMGFSQALRGLRGLRVPSGFCQVELAHGDTSVPCVSREPTRMCHRVTAPPAPASTTPRLRMSLLPQEPAMLRLPTSLLLLACGQVSSAANIHVPKDHATIQAAIDSAASGDTILVDAGRYSERVRLREGITLRSSGDDSPGQRTLKRAEETIIDGGGKNGDRPGVAMAEGSTLDGFTVTNVGVFDEAYWKKHFDTQGEELGDDEGSTQAEGTVPAVSIRGANCTVTHNVVHHNGDVGIAIVGVKGHRTAPVVLRNISHRNLGGGIGSRRTSRAAHPWEYLYGKPASRNRLPERRSAASRQCVHWQRPGGHWLSRRVPAADPREHLYSQSPRRNRYPHVWHIADRREEHLF